MKWQGREKSSNVEDRRGQRGPTGMGGGVNPFGRSGGRGIPLPSGRSGGIGGIIGIVVVLGIIWLVTGTNPIDMMTGGGSTATAPASQLTQAEEDEMSQFVGVVIKETEDLWNREFAEGGSDYPEPTVVLFTGGTQSACGMADARTGPFYCPIDQQVYIDLSFYDELRSQFGAPGDFAQAYVLAHEIGHHVQKLTGVLDDFQQRAAGMDQEAANRESVKVELQADCYAGVWANYAGEENLLDKGDIDEAINAANQIGDDTLQERMQGFAVPKTFNHGTSAQRKEWFTRGYQSGNPADCDTFASGAV